MRGFGNSMVAVGLVLLLLLLSASKIHAQVFLTGFTDVGKNVLTNSEYKSLYCLPAYRYRKLTLESGTIWTFTERRKKKFEGYSIAASLNFMLLKKPVTLTGYYLRKFTNEIRSIHINTLFSSSGRHFDYVIGNNYKKYRLAQNVSQNTEHRKKGTSIIEPINLVYSLTYNLNKKEKFWNVGFTITDYDFQTTEAETNPMVQIKGSCLIGNNLLPFVQMAYKTAGLLNLRVNYFGYYFRMGVVWGLIHD
jgi:hypothetical protein